MGIWSCCGPEGEAGWSSWDKAAVCMVRVWVCAGCPVCSLLILGWTLSLPVQFKLILLVLPSFILLSLSVNLSLCLVHHVCDSYPVNSQHLTCPRCQPKLSLEKEFTVAS